MSRFQHASVDRRILALAVPALGSLAVEPIYVITDTAIIGRLGTQQLAGLAIAASVLSIVFAGANFLTYGTTQQVAKRLGAGDRAGAANVGMQAMWLAVVFGIPAALLLGIGARTVVGVFGATGAIADHAVDYLSISAIGVPFILVTLAAQGVLRGAANYTTPLWILLAANVANLVLELVFVFVFDWGVPGSAWSTVISQAAAAAAFVQLMRRQLAGAAVRRPSWTGMSPLVTAGRHLLLRVGSMLVVLSGSTLLAARIDDSTLAAHQIVLTMFAFLALVLDALAVPAQTIVAEELGRGDAATAALVSRRSVVLSVGTGIALAALLAMLAPVLPRVFTGDAAVIDRATSGLWWLAAIMLPGAIAFAYDGILIGAGDYRFLGRAAFGYTIVVVPFAVLILLFPSVGIGGIWGAMLIWMLLRAGVNHRHAGTVLALRR
ncbi:MAG TPA: MATE family efflux transporter [Ilumatobacter sp.]|nr:MATE family efflux transporter [Ilumatobacter sp.]